MRWVNAVALTLFVSTPALGGWQWAQWGMTPEQVQAAAPVRTAAYADARLDTAALQSRLVTTHRAMGFDFSVAMLFDRRSNGLAEVRLLLKDEGKCPALEGELRRVYGAPEAIAPMGVRRWRDGGAGNMVTLQPIGGCWLVYEPIPTQESSGL
jgi:hypothetical protein